MPDRLAAHRGPIDTHDAQTERQRARWGDDAPVPTEPSTAGDDQSTRRTRAHTVPGDTAILPKPEGTA